MTTEYLNHYVSITTCTEQSWQSASTLIIDNARRTTAQQSAKEGLLIKHIRHEHQTVLRYTETGTPYTAIELAVHAYCHKPITIKYEQLLMMNLETINQ